MQYINGVSNYIFVSLLDQELISYRYSSCSSCWGFRSSTWSKKPKAPSFLNRIGIKFGKIIPQIHMHQLTKSDFWCDVILSRWRPWHHFMLKSVATWWVNMKHLRGSYAANYASSWSIVHSYLLPWGEADIVYLCCYSSCVDNERSSAWLDACTANVSRRFSRHLVHLLAGCQHVWMEVIRGQPCLDIWTWSSKSSHTSGIYGGHSRTLQCVLNNIYFHFNFLNESCFIVDVIRVIKCRFLQGKISPRCSLNLMFFGLFSNK